MSGSHAGVSAAQFAVAVPLHGCFLNDAGLGKDNAGIAGLALLQYPAAAYSHMSARIGDAADAWANGKLTHLNEAGRAAGWREGLTVPGGGGDAALAGVAFPFERWAAHFGLLRACFVPFGASYIPFRPVLSR